jgi:hypothetical protein
MKQLPLSQFHQVYSNSIIDRPGNVWVIDLESEGVLAEVVERCAASSTGWTGWGFLLIESDLDYTTACLLFEHKEDAVMAKLVYGDRLYAN